MKYIIKTDSPTGVYFKENPDVVFKNGEEVDLGSLGLNLTKVRINNLIKKGYLEELKEEEPIIE